MVKVCRLFSGKYTYTFAYAYDAANRLTAVNGQAYTWDANGNLKNDGSKVYTYTQANRLITVTAAGLTWSATYNGDGARLRQVTDGVPTTYTLDLAALLPVVLQAKTGMVTTLYLFDSGTRPLAQYDSSACEYLLPDGLGSVRQVADAGGHIKLIESYEPYGSVLSSQGSATSAFGFSGEQTDSTGLVFLRARYMQPTLGMFLTEDTVPMSVMQPSDGEEYLYANGNLVNHTDPSGLCVFCEPGDRVRVDARPDRIAYIYARPDQDSPTVDSVFDEQRVRVSQQIVQRGQDEWRKVLTASSRAGWILDRKLLDNCEGPPGAFGCLPVAR